MNTDSLAVLLLTNRLVEVDAKPLAAGEIWKLLSRLPQIGLVLECSAETLVSDHGLEIAEAERANQVCPTRQRRELHHITQGSGIDLHWIEGCGEEEEWRQHNEEEVEILPAAHVRGDGEAGGTKRESDEDHGEWSEEREW